MAISRESKKKNGTFKNLSSHIQLTGFHSYPQTTYSCIAASQYPWQLTLGCTTDALYPSPTVILSSIILISGTSTSVIPTFQGNGGGVSAYSIQVRFQATDFPMTTSSLSTSTSTPMSTVSGEDRGISGGLSLSC